MKMLYTKCTGQNYKEKPNRANDSANNLKSE